jgi:hypothetical protein
MENLEKEIGKVESEISKLYSRDDLQKSLKDKIYVSNSGVTTCIKHAGAYLESELRIDPNLKEIVTPLDYWVLEEGISCESCNLSYKTLQ